MRKIALLCGSFATMFMLALPLTSAWALNMVSFVSGSGSDTNNNCSNAAAPCQSLSQALTNTRDKGTVMCVGNGVTDNSTIFGGTTISQSVTIDCGAARLFSLGLMTINGPGIIVRLRNLSFDGSGRQPNFAISAVSMAELHVENCSIHNFTGSPGAGIIFSPGGNTRSRLTVSNTVITGSAGQSPFSAGILIQPTGFAFTQVVIERTRIEQGLNGILVDVGAAPVQVQVKDSVIANNNTGVFAGAGNLALAVISLSDSHTVANGFGVFATGQQAVVILDRTTIQASTTQAVGASNGGSVYSYGNNPINNNAAAGTSPTVIAPH